MINIFINLGNIKLEIFFKFPLINIDNKLLSYISVRFAHSLFIFYKFIEAPIFSLNTVNNINIFLLLYTMVNNLFLAKNTKIFSILILLLIRLLTNDGRCGV